LKPPILTSSLLSTGVERVLNPSLVGQAIGIVQKSILATSSHEARVKGVKKLSALSDALKILPDLILVNGEDLTKYREFSRRVTNLVTGLIGGGGDSGKGVEKLGMDEVSEG
jgi:DNA polymerase iota